jgi:parallel beta-helix repeat protein
MKIPEFVTRCLRIETIMFAVLLCWCSAANAATYCVSTMGSDTNQGTELMPFRTLNKGVKLLKPGDTLYVRAGTYAEFLGNLPGGNSWSTPVTIAAYPGQSVTLRPASGENVFRFDSSSERYIIVEGLIIDGKSISGNAIKITSGTNVGTAHHIRFKNCEIRNTPTSGIFVTPGADYNEFINLNVHNNGTTKYDHGLYIRGACNLVSFCQVHDNVGHGIHVYSQDNTTAAHDNVVQSNRIFNNGSRGILIGSGAKNIAYNNLVYGNGKVFGAPGITVGFGTVSSNKVYNNTIYNNAGYGITVGDYGTVTNTEIKNNILYLNGADGIRDTGTSTVKANNLTSDPKLLNPGAFDFHLKTDSPAINRGIVVSGVSTDYEGNSRPQGSAYDIGAYEYRQTK